VGIQLIDGPGTRRALIGLPGVQGSTVDGQRVLIVVLTQNGLLQLLGAVYESGAELVSVRRVGPCRRSGLRRAPARRCNPG
jgi:hypothetical protein